MMSAMVVLNSVRVIERLTNSTNVVGNVVICFGSGQAFTKINQHQAAPKHLWGTCALVVQMVPPASLASHHLRMSLLSSLRSMMLIRHCCGAADPEAAAWLLLIRLLGHRTQASAGSTSVPGRSPSRSSLRSCRDKRRRMKNEPIGKGFFLVVLDCGQ